MLSQCHDGSCSALPVVQVHTHARHRIARSQQQQSRAPPNRGGAAGLGEGSGIGERWRACKCACKCVPTARYAPHPGVVQAYPLGISIAVLGPIWWAGRAGAHKAATCAPAPISLHGALPLLSTPPLPPRAPSAHEVVSNATPGVEGLEGLESPFTISAAKKNFAWPHCSQY